jgi:hypothetical protein
MRRLVLADLRMHALRERRHVEHATWRHRPLRGSRRRIRRSRGMPTANRGTTPAVGLHDYHFVEKPFHDPDEAQDRQRFRVFRERGGTACCGQTSKTSLERDAF